MMGNRGLVSVIIPTYNRAEKCKIAVESVLAQTYDNVEVVVVDDGSQDNTRDVICGLDDRVKYIRQENAGVSAARNTGINNATGEYIAFLDSDDVWLPWKLEAEISVLKTFPEAGMVWTDMRAVDEDGVLISESYLEKFYSAYDYFDRERDFELHRNLSDSWQGCPQEYKGKKCYSGNIFSWMFMGNLVHTSTVLLRCERQEKVGLFNVDLLKSGEDYDFHFRTCREGHVAYIDVPSILYCVGAADQLTESRYMTWMARNDLKTIKTMYASAKDEIDLPQPMIRKRFAESHAWVGFSEFPQNRVKARREFFNSLCLLPFQKRVLAYWCLSFLKNGTVEYLLNIIRVLKKILKKKTSYVNQF